MSAARTLHPPGSRELITPEGIDLRVYLADIGARISAFFIDFGIIIGTLIAMTFGLGSFIDTDNAEFVAVVWLLFAFFLRSFYFMFFEMGPKAATPGKRICKIRVAARGKARLTANAVFARNALREIEVFLPLSFLAANTQNIDGWIATMGLIWSLIFLFFPLFNKDRLRAGDLIAGTWVVKAPRPVLASDLAASDTTTRDLFAFTPEQVNAYGVHELHVLENVIRNQDPVIVKDVSDRIRKKIDWHKSLSENDIAFLKAYYGALRGRLESRMLFGVRRKDKHDTR